MGTVQSTNNPDNHLGQNYDKTQSQNGAYNYGYQQGWHDGCSGSGDNNPVDYLISALFPSGNKGYANGYNDAQNGKK
jgi:hypothetical protein